MELEEYSMTEIYQTDRGNHAGPEWPLWLALSLLVLSVIMGLMKG